MKLSDRTILRASGFLADLAKAHLQDERAAKNWEAQAADSFKAWADHAQEYLAARFGIVTGNYHYVPSIQRIVFIPKLARGLDVLTGGYLPNPLRCKLLRALDGWVDLVKWPEAPDMLLEAQRANFVAMPEAGTQAQAWEQGHAIARRMGKVVK